MRRGSTWIFIAFLALAAARTAAAQPAADPSPDDLAKAKTAYQRGAELFAEKDFAGAVAQFKESYRLTRNPLLLYNIGYTLDELGDKKLAVFYYRKFLEHAPKNVKNRDTAARRARELEAELAGKAPPSPEKTGVHAMATAPAKPHPAAGPDAFSHEVVGEAPPGKPLDISAVAPENVGWSVFLFYRGAHDSDFVKVPMKRRGGELVGRVPASRVSGSSLQYYIEVRDVGDEVVTRSGRSSSPHVVMVDDSAKARFYADMDDETPDLSPSPTPGQDRGERRTMELAKWGSTGASLGFLALSMTFLYVASNASSSIEGEAVSSGNDSCTGGPPCRNYDSQRDLEARGKRFETLGNISLGLAVAAGATAGVLWYLDKGHGHGHGDSSGHQVSAAPAVGKGFVGAAARVRF